MSYGYASLGMLSALLIGPFIEYIAHRTMHRRWKYFFGEQHYEHHKDNKGDGFLVEWYPYVIGIIPLMPFGFIFGVHFTIGWILGGLTYTALAAYVHQLSHEHPECIFWQRRPIHYLHHRYYRGTKNYGVITPFWDKVFGTFAECAQYKHKKEFSLRKMLSIRWY